MLRSGTLSATESLLSLLSKLIPLTFMPFTRLIPTTPTKDIPLNMLLAKLSLNKPKSLTDVGEGRIDSIFCKRETIAWYQDGSPIASLELSVLL
jgi:hypothetical protein